MNFNFKAMKPVIQQEFDAVFDLYPTDMTVLRKMIPTGGDPLERKRIIVGNAAQMCPVHIFPHYPFAFEMDMGEVRHVCYLGVGNESQRHSGVDFTALYETAGWVREQHVASFGDFTDHFHRTLDHDKLLRLGFRGVWEECARLNETETDPEKKRYRELVMFLCECVRTIGLRLRDRAAEMLRTPQDEDAVHNLTRIVQSANTPWEPPVTLFDAFNTILCTTLFISGLDGVEMNCYGQLDRLMEPFYRHDLQADILTEEEAYFLLQCFLHKTDMHCHFNEERTTYDNGVSVMTGGCDPEGKPVYNAMTRLILRAYMENKLINPKLNARASAESPREYIEQLISLVQTGNNNLVIENDDYIIPMFRRMGLSLEDARTYVGNGCQEVVCRNQFHRRASVYLNMPNVLLHTLQYNDETLPEPLRRLYCYGTFRKDSFAALFDSFRANLHSLIRVIAETLHPYEKQHAFINPEPMLSAFTADCLRDGRDITENGARYNHHTLAMVGFGTLCDSLLSLRRAFAAGTQQTLLDAMAADFSGYDLLARELTESRDRFGHSPEADAYARELAEALAGVSRGIYSAQGVEWRTSLFTYYQFREFGSHTAATPDGRRAGTSFSRQMNMARLPELTAAALSMHQLTDADFNDVGMFDFTLPFSSVSGEETKQALVDFLRTCIALRLPVMQPNIVDVRLLEEERQHKGTHPDLVVRVCGYSALYGQLPAHMQEEIIRRANAS